MFKNDAVRGWLVGREGGLKKKKKDAVSTKDLG